VGGLWDGRLGGVPGPTRRNPANPARSGRKQRQRAITGAVDRPVLFNAVVSGQCQRRLDGRDCSPEQFVAWCARAMVCGCERGGWGAHGRGPELKPFLLWAYIRSAEALRSLRRAKAKHLAGAKACLRCKGKSNGAMRGAFTPFRMTSKNRQRRNTGILATPE